MSNNNPKFDFEKKYYHLDNFLRKTVFLKDGKKHGPDITFYDNGRIHIIYYYQDGELTSDSMYTEEGFLESYHEYKDGKDDGKSFWYSGKKLYNEKIREDGKIIENRYFHENGQIIVDFNYDSGKKNGKSIFYNENGHIGMKMNYKNNKRHGKYIIYQPCEYGSVLLKGKFKNDKLYGKQEHFFPDGKQRGVQVFEDGNLVSSSGDVSFVLLNQYKEQTMDSKLY